MIKISSYLLDRLNTPDKIKKATFKQLNVLSSDIRKRIVEVVSKNGGHLASNLGVVELTIALLRCFDPPNDKIVFDVGHQCYAYKMLTGRLEEFATIRTENGISGYPKTSESPYDAFIAGHASTSLSAAFGLKSAMTINGKKDFVVAVIGDGALTGGMSYEAFNNIGKTKENLIIILNDNEMAISKNEGAMAKYLAAIRNKKRYFALKDSTEKLLSSVPFVGDELRNGACKVKKSIKQIFYVGTFFENLGFRYYGPVNGHDIKTLCDVLNDAKEKNVPAVIHINTQKGKGYLPSEDNPGEFHGISKFDPFTGKTLGKSQTTFSENFGHWLLKKGRENNKICAVTAAMEHGTCMQYFAREFKDKGRYFDVGIAEEHAVTFTASLACGGAVPIFAIYSTFLQRGYDQLIHDASIEKQHIVLAIDRAGIVGDDGETHQGLFDVAFLSTIPGFTIFSPSNFKEQVYMLNYAVDKMNTPVAVRYPRGAESEKISSYEPTGRDFDIISKNSDTAVLTYGRLFAECVKAAESADFDIVKVNRVFPVSDKLIASLLKYKNILFFEEGVLNGSLSQRVSALLMEKGFSGRVKIHAIDNFVPQGRIDSMTKKLGLDADSMIEEVSLCRAILED